MTEWFPGRSVSTLAADLADDPGLRAAFAVRRRQVADRASFPAFSRNVTNTGGTNTQVQQIASFVLTEDVDDLAFTYGNFYRDSAADMALNGLANVTVRSGIWDGTATYPVYWPNGSRDLTIEPGGVATTTPLFFKGRRGQRVWIVRLMTWAIAPAAFPAATLIANTATEVNEWGTALTDRTTAYGQIFTRSAGNWAVFPPLAITATAKPGPVVAILGDSIASDGANDYNSDDPAYGWAQGGLSDAGIPWVNLGTSSLASSHVLSSRPGRAQLFAALIASGATHLLYALSTNDWSSGRTSANLLADLATLKDELDPLGVKLIPCTSLPKTNAANNAQLAGETNTFAQRALFNAALLAGNGVGYGFYDLAAVAQSPTDPNLWRTDLRAAAGLSVVSGGTGYKGNDVVILPGGVSANVAATGGAVTAVQGVIALGGWVVDPPASVTPLRVVSNDPASRGIPAGTGASFSYTGIAAQSSTTDGTHPQAPMTRWIRQDFAADAPALFTV